MCADVLSLSIKIGTLGRERRGLNVRRGEMERGKVRGERRRNLLQFIREESNSINVMRIIPAPSVPQLSERFDTIIVKMG
jgi:hypothetical protein